MASPSPRVSATDVRRSVTVRDPAGKPYAIVAVKRGLPFQEGSFTGSGIVDLIVGLVLESVLERRAVRQPQWKVAVGRARWSGSGVAHKETLPPGVDPAERMTELSEAVKLGAALN